MHPLQDGDRTAALDLLQAQLETVSKPSGYPLPIRVGLSKQLSGDANDQLTVRNELNEGLDGHSISVEPAPGEPQPCEGVERSGHPAIMPRRWDLDSLVVKLSLLSVAGPQPKSQGRRRRRHRPKIGLRKPPGPTPPAI